MPKVSVILPVYNGEARIENALRSVLAQRFDDFEILVIDDGSTDRTAEIVKFWSEKDSRVIYSKNEQNLGIQKSLNKGLHLARGEYIARIDDDDEWAFDDKLSKQVAFLDHHPDYVLLGTGTIVVDENGKEIFRFLTTEKDEDIRKEILGKNCFTHASVMFRKSVALSLGGYDESFETRHAEDYDLWLKLGKLGKLANLPIYGVRWMLRKGSISGRNPIFQFKRVLGLCLKYRHDYPNFLAGYLRSLVRLVAYGFFKVVPILRFKYWLFRTGREK